MGVIERINDLSRSGDNVSIKSLDIHHQAVMLLAECWERHKPEAVAAREDFSNSLTVLSPMTRAVIGEIEWWNCINSFCRKNCAEWRHETNRIRGQMAAKKCYAQHEYSTDPRNVQSIRRKRELGIVTAADKLEPKPMPRTAVGEQSARSLAKRLDRKARGVVIVQAEISTITGNVTLLSRLPPSLQQFATWTVKRALYWCEQRLPVARDGAKKAALLVKRIEQVQRWCGCSPRLDLTLGEQLTQDIIDEVIETKPEAKVSYARSSWNSRP